MSERKFKYVGTRPIRHDGLDKVTGRADYGADFTLPGMIHATCARSPYAHARILSHDSAGSSWSVSRTIKRKDHGCWL